MTSLGGLSRRLPCGAGVGIAWPAGAVAYRKVSPCERAGEGLRREEGPAARGWRTVELPVGLQGPECGHEVSVWLISKSFSFSVRKDIFAHLALGLTNRMKRLSGRLRALGAPLQERGSLSGTAGLRPPGPHAHLRFPPAEIGAPRKLSLFWYLLTSQPDTLAWELAAPSPPHVAPQRMRRPPALVAPAPPCSPEVASQWQRPHTHLF